MVRFLLAFIRLIIATGLTLIFLFLLLFAYSIGMRLSVRYFLLKYWAISLGYILGLVIHLKKRPIPKGVLILPNHRSWIDIPLILGIIPATIISKKEISYWPVIGWGFSAIDAILVDRSKMGSLIRTIKEIRKKILDHKTVIIFPEGKRYRGPETGPFKTGSFKLAAETGISIIPVALEYKNSKDVCIHGEKIVLHYFRSMGKLRTHIKVEIGEAFSSTDEKELLGKTKKWMDETILNMRKEWDQA